LSSSAFFMVRSPDGRYAALDFGPSLCVAPSYSSNVAWFFERADTAAAYAVHNRVDDYLRRGVAFCSVQPTPHHIECFFAHDLSVEIMGRCSTCASNSSSANHAVA
jgi:hypothetical protein